MRAGVEAVRRGDRVRHRDGTEGVALADLLGGCFAALVPGLGVVEWWASEVEVLGREGG